MLDFGIGLYVFNLIALCVFYVGLWNYKIDLVIDLGWSNHTTGDTRKLQDMTNYKGGCVVVTTNNSQQSIAHIGTTVLTARYGPHKVSL